MAVVILPASADTADYTQPDPVSCNYPWWEICPPVVTKTRVVVRQAETMIESIPAEGWCYTAIKQVNVRSQPSIYATRVMRIKSAGTEFTVTARAKNSAGEIWYAVQLANGTLGYIRSDLLNTDHVILLGDPYSSRRCVRVRVQCDQHHRPAGSARADAAGHLCGAEHPAADAHAHPGLRNA